MVRAIRRRSAVEMRSLHDTMEPDLQPRVLTSAERVTGAIMTR